MWKCQYNSYQKNQTGTEDGSSKVHKERQCDKEARNEKKANEWLHAEVKDDKIVPIPSEFDLVLTKLVKENSETQLRKSLVTLKGLSVNKM